ncbi:MAG: ABC transporter permease subunit [Brasilonema octagenarum HA4186-MV1]|jgi:peptide/nickel transport system permease protein|uniref:ABC transporter permease n=2 Tax=Brasilonema TaxID=383614 RepID=A0A856MMN9_9CYAN|nr:MULTISPECIES: ABC transporter permease [Brasilonema]MBW4624304.1 ABC transporter permease subunit [Brasilonema octagenarum HA4186-MV1]NMF64856.1 ABC transporter permease [Brasilonema octagenarum UFV-OR1]QDL11938.1 ABC transporter permease [Brasilonema sennae CENA114]QDL18312.1 ABC transporter permease [Brasilonema octagenarum UFV-E1]
MTTTRISLDASRDWLLRLVTSESFIYVTKRLLQALLTLFLASALSFIIIQLAPGDYVDTLRQNPKISPERIEELRRQFGLDKSWPEQFGLWVWRIITQGDFGTSFVYQRSVGSLLWERVPATLLLAVASLIVTWAIAIPLGIVAAVKQNQLVDRILQIISYAGQGFPSFITALLLLILAQNLSPIFPVGDMTSINHNELNWFGQILDIGWHMILPTIALSVTSFAGLQRITRGELLDVLRQDYIQTARAKGLPENRVVYVHALRNAINPLITLLGFELAGLLGGAFIAEFFFNWPGLGRLTLQAVQAQDLYLVMASLVMSAVLLSVGNLIADLLLKVSDPRIRLENLN